jgi:signal transduction histidine kinase
MIQARDQLLLDVSHELRSPLTRIKVALALHADDELKSEISADVTEMEAMITELLELERLREGHGICCQLQDIVPIIRELVRSYKGRSLDISDAGVPASVLLNVDRDKFRTVLRNLIENAYKYSLPDSSPIELSVEQEGGRTIVRVRDDGPGVPTSDIPNLFEPFFRVDRSRSKKTGGYGLGLSICKRIMDAHEGSIAVENNPDRGASFLLAFPTPGTGAHVGSFSRQTS